MSTTLSQPISLADDNPCFTLGTHIATDRGEVAVEELRVGDAVLTVSGPPRPIA